MQRNIEQKITALSYVDDPRTAAPWDDCGSDDEECPYIIQIFPGIPYEFTYELDPINHTLLFIDCYRLPIFDHLDKEQ